MIPNTNNQMLNSYLHHVYGDDGGKWDPEASVPTPETGKPEGQPEVSRGTVAWLGLEGIWNELVSDGAAPEKLHELMIHAMHYAQHEARMMVLNDIGVLVKKAGNK